MHSYSNNIDYYINIPTNTFAYSLIIMKINLYYYLSKAS
jgi:hypothetical protein